MEDLDYSNEIWLPVVGWEGLYEVSNFGRVKRLFRYYSQRKHGKIFKQKLNEKTTFGSRSYGYLRVQMSNGEIRKEEYIHRLVAQAFIPNTENKPFIDHINTIKTDNRVENLRWVTAKENTRNEITYNRICEARKNPTCSTDRHVDKIDPESMEIVDKFYKVASAAKSINVSESSIHHACRSYPNIRFGFYWRYANKL